MPVYKTEAARVFFEPDIIQQNTENEFRVNLLIDSEGENINTIGGEIIIPDGLKVQKIFYGESSITFWVEKPEEQDNKIIFSGIIPGGFEGILTPTGLIPGNIMTIVFKSEDEKNKEVALNNIQIFLNDGQGTSVSDIKADNFEYVYDENSKPEKQFSDNISPENFDIELVQQDDKNFLVFYAQDKESGVKYYEIKIGSNDWKAVNSPYEISQFDLLKDIKIKAVDGFGNVTISEFNKNKKVDEHTSQNMLYVVLLILIAFVFGRFALRYYVQKNKT